MSIALKGILPVLPTPFNPGGGIDKPAMKKIVRFCMESGAHGVVFPGVASEVGYLDAVERWKLLKVVCSEVGKEIPVVCGASANTPDEVIGYAASASELGAVAAMVLIPNCYESDPQGALQFMRLIAKRLPDTEIILQNAPPPVGAGLDPDAVSGIVREFENVRYVKEEALPSGPRISAISSAAPRHFKGAIGGAGGRYLIDEMNRGACAAMPAIEIADIHVKMWNAHHAGDTQTSRTLFARTLPLLMIQAIYRMRLTKTVLERRGIMENAIVRAPLPEFDIVDHAEITAQLSGISDLLHLAPMKVAA